MNKLKADPENCIWFYSRGWRYGEIMKYNSDTQITVRDCSGSRYRCRQTDSGWIAIRSDEYKKKKASQKAIVKKVIKKAKGKKKFKIRLRKKK